MRSCVVGGGANTVQQYLQAGLLDEIHLSLVPILLCDGLRLFEDVGTEPIELERTRIVETPWAGHADVTHLQFRAVQ